MLCFEVVLVASGPLKINANFHGDSNDTIGGRVRLRGQEISPFWCESSFGGIRGL
jgi:hypothetical protein